MTRRLAFLSTLRSFEPAARLLKAAEVLQLTKGTLSQAIRHLEDHLGLPPKLVRLP